jgi:hypothetical protein
MLAQQYALDVLALFTLIYLQNDTNNFTIYF